MNRKPLMLALIMTLVVLPFMIQNVEAVHTNYSIQEVSHTIEVMYNGYIFLNDTIQLDGAATDSFLLGFPYQYGSHVVQCTAYNATQVFPVTLNVPLQNRTGFYGVRISFPQETPQIFTVGFMLSHDLLVRESENVTRVDFPVYPSLTKKAGVLNASIILPPGSEYVEGTVDSLTYSKESLAAFAYEPGNVAFSPPVDGIQKVDITQVDREIKLKGMKDIQFSDTYLLTNRDSKEVDSFRVVLPQNASPPNAYDRLERELKTPQSVPGETNRYTVSFTLKTGESFTVANGASYVFTIQYSLPAEGCIEPQASDSFHVTLSLFPEVDYYILQSSTTFVLPEGGKIVDFRNASTPDGYSISRNVFQERLTVHRQGVFSVNSFTVHLTYEYNMLWVSFRPTLWTLALAVVGCAIALVWRRPEARIPVTAPQVEVGVSSQDIQAFVDHYERKRKIVSKLKSVKTKARKGKISRRRYKVRRKTLETRLETLTRKLDDLDEKLRAAGGRYRDLMRRLEVAETEINEVESNVRSIDARHRRGELSLGAHHKLLSEYEERREKAETTINRILIRLREEIR